MSGEHFDSVTVGEVSLDEMGPRITIQVQIPDGANGYVSLATNVDQFVSRETIDNMTDKLHGAAVRIRAKTQLPALLHERDGEKSLLDDNRVRLAEMDAGHKARTRNRSEDAGKALAKRAEVYRAAADDHLQRGLRSDFSEELLRGRAKQEYKALAATKTLIDAAQKKDDDEHAVTRSQLENEIKRREEGVKILERRIAECEAQIGGEVSNGSDGRSDLQHSA
jgi:hypothetical protein